MRHLDVNAYISFILMTLTFRKTFHSLCISFRLYQQQPIGNTSPNAVYIDVLAHKGTIFFYSFINTLNSVIRRQKISQSILFSFIYMLTSE